MCTCIKGINQSPYLPPTPSHPNAPIQPQIKSVGLQLIGQLDSAESSSSDSDDSSSDSSDNSMGVQEWVGELWGGVSCDRDEGECAIV